MGQRILQGARLARPLELSLLDRARVARLARSPVAGLSPRPVKVKHAWQVPLAEVEEVDARVEAEAALVRRRSALEEVVVEEAHSLLLLREPEAMEVASWSAQRRMAEHLLASHLSSQGQVPRDLSSSWTDAVQFSTARDRCLCTGRAT